jgi:hypothetical protein
MLTHKGIKPGRNKLQAIWDAQPPTNIKMVSLLDFAIYFAHTLRILQSLLPHFSESLEKTLAIKMVHCLQVLQQQLTSEPVMAFPFSDRCYALITDTSTGTADSPGGLGAILTQVDEHGNHYAIYFVSRQLKDHEQNYSPFLLEAAAAVWGMEVFNE